MGVTTEMGNLRKAELVKGAMDAAVHYLQCAIGRMDGDFAALYFDDNYRLQEALATYLEAELDEIAEAHLKLKLK